MTRVIAGMTMSLDGYVADTGGNVDRLYPDFEALQGSDFLRATIDETGAVIMGRSTFDMAGDPDTFADTYEYQTPIFVLTHHPPAAPPKENEHLTFTFVSGGLPAAVKQAKAAAGDKAVTVVGGASLIQDLLLEGLADELHIDIMPVFLGEGLRLFEAPALQHVELEKVAVQDVGARSSLRFRVVPRSGSATP